LHARGGEQSMMTSKEPYLSVHTSEVMRAIIEDSGGNDVVATVAHYGG